MEFNKNRILSRANLLLSPRTIGYDLKDEFSGLYLPGYVSGTQPDIAPSFTPVEMLTNGNLNTATGNDFAGWTETAGSGAIAAETVNVHTAAGKAAKLTYVTGTANMTQAVTSVFPGLVYDLIIWTAGDGSVAGQYQVYDVTNSAAIKALGTTGVTSTSYTQVTYQFTAPKGCTSVRVDLYSPASAGSAYFDDVSLMLAPNQAKRRVTDSEGKVSVDNSVAGKTLLRFTGGRATPGTGDPLLIEPPVSRAAGKLCLFEISNASIDNVAQYATMSPTSAFGTEVGLARSHMDWKIYLSYWQTVATASAGSTKIFAALRSAGQFAFLKDTSLSQWRLLYVSSIGSYANLYPQVSSYNAAFTSDFIRIPSQLWLPSPLISDGFSGTDGAALSSRTTDGLGHAEGIAGGIGAGGSGQTWLGSSGSIVAASGRAKITPTAGSELGINGDFEGSFVGGLAVNWLKHAQVTATEETTTFHGGAKAQRITTSQNGTGLYAQNVSVKLGQWYYLSAWIYLVSGTGVTFTNTNGPAALTTQGAAIVSTTGTWTKRELSGRCTLEGLDGCYFKLSAASDVAIVDDASFKLLTTSSLFSSIQAITSNIVAGLDIWMTARTQCGMVLCLDSATNPQNFILAYHDGTNAKVDTCIAGVYTNRINAAATYVAGARLIVITDTLSDGSFTVDLYYNNVKIGSTYTAANGSAEATAFKANRLHGIFSTYEENTVDNFVVYPRGTEGQYSYLDNF